MGENRRFLGQLGRAIRSIGGRRRDETGPTDLGERRRTERRVEPRVDIEGGADHDSIRLVIDGRAYDLHDLSVSGVCVHAPDGVPGGAELGVEINAIMRVGQTEIPMRLLIANRRGDHVGWAIAEAGSVWREIVGQILDPVLLGQRLREIDPRFVKAEPERGKCRWFQGGPACDLFVWYDLEERIESTQLFFMGQVVEWSSVHGLRSGTVSEMPRESLAHGTSDLFDLQKPPDGEAVGVARRILGAANVPYEIRKLFFG